MNIGFSRKDAKTQRKQHVENNEVAAFAVNLYF